MNIPLNINWQQILLHLLNFAILAGGLYVLLYHPVKKFMDQRVSHYREMDDQACAKMDEAEHLKAEYAERLEQAEEEAHKLRAKAQQSVQAAAEQQMEEARKCADDIIVQAQKTAERNHDKVLRESQKELQDMAVTATEKLLLTTGGDVFDQFLDAAERGESHDN